MNLFDIIVIAIIFLSTVVGFFRGVVYLSISLIAFISAIYFAYVLSPFVQPFVLEYIHNKFASKIVGGLISYLLTTIFFMILSSQVRAILKDVRGGLIDRLFGLIVGGIRGCAISLVLFFAIVVISTNSYVGVSNIAEVVEKTDKSEYPKFIVKSLSYPFISSVIGVLSNIVTKDTLKNITIPSRGNVMDDVSIMPSLGIKIDLNNAEKDPKSSDSDSSLELELQELISQ